MKIYNTLTREKEDFKPIKAGEVGIYGCGVTPYKPAHLGHALQGVVFDIMRRYFEYKGYKVTYVRNYTDIDDKIINRAAKLRIHPLELSAEIIKQTDKVFDALRVKRATHEPKVSENIEGIIELTKLLIDNGNAYVTDKGNVYFKVSSFAEYGKLSNQKVDQLKAGSRKEVEDDKQSPNDFALWKAEDSVQQLWDSPWGHGRPGWHIECSVMSMRYLGTHFDIHGGGGDLIFPHHENEIAQSESVHGHFANYWVHNGLLMVGDDKMSKSLDNDVSIEAWLKKFHPEVIRYMIITNHYRSNVQFVPDRYREANKKVYQGYKTLLRASSVMAELSPDTVVVKKLMKEFEEYMDDDFNTVKVVAMLHRLLGEVNSGIDEGDAVTVASNRAAILRIGGVLGLFDLNPNDVISEMEELHLKEVRITRDEIDEKIRERVEYKNKKEFDKADAVREELEKYKITLLDFGGGTEWEVDY